MRKVGALIQCSWPMLVYDTAGCEGGEGSDEMLLQLGCCMR